MDIKTIILEYVCPGMGCIVGTIMFSAPYSDLQKAIVRGHLGDLNPTPWAFMLGNCCGWVTYSFLRQNLWIFIGNAPGLILSVWLNMGAAKLQYQGHRSQEMKQSFVTYLMEQQQQQQQDTNLLVLPKGSVDDGIEAQPTEQDNNDHDHDHDDDKVKTHKDQIPKQYDTHDYGKLVWEMTSQTSSPAPAPHEMIVMIMVIIWVACIALIAFSTTSLTHTTRELIVGLLVNGNLVFFYGAPLSTIMTVVKTQNSASIHIWTMITNTSNGIFWGAYGLAVLDPFVYIPNGLGAALGVIQIFLCLTFPRIPSALVGGDGGGSDGMGSELQEQHRDTVMTSFIKEETTMDRTLLHTKVDNREEPREAVTERLDSSPEG